MHFSTWYETQLHRGDDDVLCMRISRKERYVTPSSLYTNTETTTGTQVIIKVSGYKYQRLAGVYDLVDSGFFAQCNSNLLPSYSLTTCCFIILHCNSKCTKTT